MNDFDPELLISLYLNGNGLMTKEDFEKLSEWIRDDAEHTRLFVHAAFSHQATHESLLNSDIQKNIQLDASCTGEDSDSPYDCDIWQALAVNEKMANSIVIEKPGSEDEILENVVLPARTQRPNTTSLLLVIGSVAALIIMLAFVHFNPKVLKEEVASITESINAEWATNDTSALKGDRLYNNSDSLYLLKGFVKIEFDYGATVVLEGPAEIKINSSDDMVLSYGRLYSHVPENATGFTVETPHSRIVDLGTEFGVKVDIDGRTDVHMFKGKASLIPGKKGQTGKSQILSVGQSRRIDTMGNLTEILMETKSFVRKIYSKTGVIWRGKNIDLADIVGGGDGFGSANNGIGIYPLTGKFVQVKGTTEEEQQVQGGFKAVLQSKWIDSVFVPDGGEGPVQISQNGLSFDGFGDTSGTMHAHLSNQKDFSEEGHEGKNLSVGKKPCIYMHTNLGVTFDLNKIREKFGREVNIKAFKSQSGFRYFSGMNNKADFWVLVDGQLRYKREGAVCGSGLEKIEIPIDPDDHFLTLVTTESDDGMGDDWTMFVDPMLILK